MDEILTIAQIEEKFDSEWVLIEEPRTDDALEVNGGTVRWHGKDREEVYCHAIEIRPKRFAIVYTGKMPEGTKWFCELHFRRTGPDRRSGGIMGTGRQRRAPISPRYRSDNHVGQCCDARSYWLRSGVDCGPGPSHDGERRRVCAPCRRTKVHRSWTRNARGFPCTVVLCPPPRTSMVCWG